MKNKYELMGRYVVVKVYLKPAKKFSARSHETIELKEPKVGMVVGYRTVYDGKIHPGSNQSGYSLDPDYSPPWFEVTGKIQVLLVCFWPRYKPVLVKMEDVIIPMRIGLKATDNLRPTLCEWNEQQKDWLRNDVKNMPRDEKGRWKK